MSQLPYPVREGNGGFPGLSGGGSGSGGGGGGSSGVGASGGGSHPLDGVVFQLSPRLTTDSELDQMSLAVEAVMTRWEMFMISVPVVT